MMSDAHARAQELRTAVLWRQSEIEYNFALSRAMARHSELWNEIETWLDVLASIFRTKRIRRSSYQHNLEHLTGIPIQPCWPIVRPSAEPLSASLPTYFDIIYIRGGYLYELRPHNLKPIRRDRPCRLSLLEQVPSGIKAFAQK
jgi:hypothetical protein